MRFLLCVAAVAALMVAAPLVVAGDDGRPELVGKHRHVRSSRMCRFGRERRGERQAFEVARRRQKISVRVPDRRSV